MFLLSQRGLFLVVIIATCVCSINAQTPETTSKRAAIQELLTVVGATQYARTAFTVWMNEYSDALAKDTIKTFENGNWSPEVRLKMETLTRDFHKRLSQRLTDELLVRVGYEALLNRLYAESYDEHFSETEIRELIAFYRTPIGQKYVGFVPKVAVSLQQKAQAAIQAPMTTITREILEEEMKLLEIKAAAELKPLTPGEKN